ncbi:MULTISPECIES: 6,7-dimethyl-8-ribityllumazine synthase [unclassified Corynebacterium]|uniref:6,7-dimethyl-8-ribityllumazine synthase n=1 Tax=unclassified Corynebacterium TaxID=2624378 RepID=UPI0029CA4E2A|nr:MULTISPECIES: 6,7-dimethyl-8-ribityllumazine synthase [unclassified Corynebacterium]WPF65144.1 6,7-dimethyl-8-ribityllumazine synthase [Corynebacterium sp. 22KM0430]WPF67640.1 6,7-dimethyl-8-ribityllumazine synthase [Corynebacterium sp. 21KM1197]
MAKEGLPAAGTSTDSLDATGLTVAVLTSTWNEEICDRLHEHAVATAKEAGASVEEFRVIGALEIPVVAQELARRYDAVVALGCVIEGGTPHFKYVCDSVMEGLAQIALAEGTPVGNGVLTTHTYEQAVERSGGEGAVEDKGAEAAIAALHTALVLRGITG